MSVVALKPTPRSLSDIRETGVSRLTDDELNDIVTRLAEAELKLSLLNASLTSYRGYMAGLGGCSNHDCLIRKPVGMGTNSQCHCHTDARLARLAMKRGGMLASYLGHVLKGEPLS